MTVLEFKGGEENTSLKNPGSVEENWFGYSAGIGSTTWWTASLAQEAEDLEKQ